MVDIIPFAEIASKSPAAQNLAVGAITEIMLGNEDTGTPIIPAECPDWAHAFIAREHRAGALTYRSIASGGMAAPHPLTAKSTRSSYSFVETAHPDRPPTIFWVFDDGNTVFSLAFAGNAGRVTHIVIPEIECVIYDFDRNGAVSIWETFKAHSPPVSTIQGSARRIGLVNMVPNFAHQAMNNLSGIQRIVDRNLQHSIDEIWLDGEEFYGSTATLFPELQGKIFHVPNSEIQSKLQLQRSDVYGVGSNFITLNLHDRLTRASARSGPERDGSARRFPLIAFTIRTDGRRCINLPEMIETVVRVLIKKYPDVGVVLDGWAFPESAIVACSPLATALSERYFARMRQEVDACRAIADRLPAGVLTRNLVGTSILESMRGIRDVDAYVAHVGTLQHKLGWFSGARGIVHGPQCELIRMEAGTYSSEMSRPPLFVAKEDVVDIPVENRRGPGFYDYEIRNITRIADAIDGILSC